MEQRLPKYHETFMPVLRVLSDGKAIGVQELRKRVRDQFYADLPRELLEEKTKSGDILILNRIGWAKAYLKQGGYVYQPERAMVQITPKGTDALARGALTLQDVLVDPDFLKHRELAKHIDGEVSPSQSESPEDLIDAGILSIENQTKAEILERLRAMDPYYFEKVVLELFKAMGYGEFETTAKSGDGGIDGIINQDQLGLEKIYIQCKRYGGANIVREPAIRGFIGAMSRDTKKGIFVTTSAYDESAVKKVKDADHVIKLIDGHKLADLMYKFNIGVQTKNSYEVKRVDEDFFEVE